LIDSNPDNDFQSWTEILEAECNRLRYEVKCWQDKVDEYRAWAYHYRDMFNATEEGKKLKQKRDKDD
jgi:hypothetical protein